MKNKKKRKAMRARRKTRLRESGTATSVKIREDVAPGSRMIIESGQSDPNKVWIDLITPGWGSSGYYSQEVLERDMPKIYPAGSHMYVDHPTISEMTERPERSVKDLAAVTLETAFWNGERQSIGAHAQLFPDHAEAIKAKASAIGVSIFADGDVEESATEIDGKTGPIVHELTEGFSADFVTLAGRGGKIGELLESAREELKREQDPVRETSRPPDGGKEVDMDKLEEVQQKLSEAEAKLKTAEEEKATAITERDEAVSRADRAEDAILLAEAHRVAETEAKDIEGLPERAIERVIRESLAEKLPLSEDGKLVKETLKERVKTKAQGEIDYLSESGASQEGRVTGLGTGVSGGGDGSNGSAVEGELSETDRTKLETSLQRLGLSESASKIAAEGR